MSTRGVYGYENAENPKTVYSAFLRWANPQENSLNLAQYSNNDSASNLVYEVGMTANLLTRQIPEASFFSKVERFWLPHLRSSETIYLYCYHANKYEQISEYLQKYPRTPQDREAIDEGHLYLDLLWAGECNYAIRYQPGSADYTNFTYFDSLDYLKTGADKIYDNPEYAYIYHEKEGEWKCHPLRDGKDYRRDADAWNRNYAETKEHEDFAESVSVFSEEVAMYTDDFSMGLDVAFDTAEDLAPGISERLGFGDNADDFLCSYFEA